MKILENTTIRLRPLEMNDLDFLYTTENNTDLWEVSSTITPFSKYVLEDYIRNTKHDIYSNKQIRLVIEPIEKKTAAGFIDIFDFDPMHLRAGIGIVISEKERRKHYAENALLLIIKYAFKTLRLEQLYCQIAEDNTISIQLFEKAGFKITGKKVKWLNTESGFKDVFFLQLINQ